MNRVPASAEGVSFGAPIPDPSSRWIYIVSPRPGSPVRLTVLAPEGVSVLTHWHSDVQLSGRGRTVPHTTPDDSCPYCVEVNQVPRWHTYLPCWWDHSSRFVLADITLYAAQRCKELVPKSGVNLRGKSLLLRRMGRSANSPVIAELERELLPPEKLPPTFDPIAALMRLWGCSSARYWRTGMLPDLR